MKNIPKKFIIKKTIIAQNVMEAIKKEKSAMIEDIHVDNPGKEVEGPQAIGFQYMIPMEEDD